MKETSRIPEQIQTIKAEKSLLSKMTGEDAFF